MSNHKRRTPIHEVASGRVGDAPATTPTAEQLATMSPDERHEVANDFWQSVMPPVPEAPTTQPTRTIADLLDG